MLTFRSARSAGLVLCLLALGCAHEGAGPGASEPPAATAEAAPVTAPAAKVAAGEQPVGPPTESKEVTYTAGATTLKGYLIWPASSAEKRPGVLVVHEWWGLNDHARAAAKKLADQGYVALAVDMYGEGKVAAHPEDAKKFMMALMSDQKEAAARFAAAQALLASDPHVDAARIAAIGYCMGGAVALHAARAGADLDAIGSFHGNLATEKPMAQGAFAGRILIATGGADPFVPPEQVAAFEKEMNAAGANYHIDVYPNAKHGFTNPAATDYGTQFNLPLAYDAEADQASWQKLVELLAQVWPEG